MKNSKINFEGQAIYIGIDCHLKSWTVTILLEHSAHKTFSMNPNAKELSAYLKKNFPGGEYFSAYEAGFCGFSVHRELEKHGIKNIVVNAADIPTTDKEKRQKEDKRDSRKIAKSLRNKDLMGIYILQEDESEFRGLVRYRKTLVKEIARNKNRIKSFLYFNGIDIPLSFQTSAGNWSGKFIEWLKTLECFSVCGTEVIVSLIDTTLYLRTVLLNINRKLRSLSKEGGYAEKLQLLMSIPGIGLIAASTLLSEIVDINRFSNFDQISSFVGLVPTTHSSGENDKTGRISNRSNRALRNILIEAAWVAVRHDPALAISFNNHCLRMKKNEAIVRSARKLLSRINYVMKNKQEYVLSVA